MDHDFSQGITTRRTSGTVESLGRTLASPGPSAGGAHWAPQSWAAPKETRGNGQTRLGCDRWKRYGKSTKGWSCCVDCVIWNQTLRFRSMCENRIFWTDLYRFKMIQIYLLDPSSTFNALSVGTFGFRQDICPVSRSWARQSIGAWEAPRAAEGTAPGAGALADLSDLRPETPGTWRVSLYLKWMKDYHLVI